MSDRSTLDTMPLYTHVDRIARGLAARGIGRNDAIPPEQLFGLASDIITAPTPFAMRLSFLASD